MDKIFVADYRPGPAWRPDEPTSRQPLQEHLEYWLERAAQGHVVMGGPFHDGTGGLVVLAVADQREAVQLVADDPAVREGVLVAQTHGWNVLVGVGARAERGPAGRPSI